MSSDNLETYHIGGHPIAARSLTQAKLAARQLEKALRAKFSLAEDDAKVKSGLLAALYAEKEASR